MKVLYEQHIAYSVPQRFVRILSPTTSVAAAQCENPGCGGQLPVKEAAVQKGRHEAYRLITVQGSALLPPELLDALDLTVFFAWYSGE